MGPYDNTSKTSMNMVKDGTDDLVALERNYSNRVGSVEDDHLSRLGLHIETTRDLGLLAIVATGWNICNSWAAVAATMAISIASGGSVTLIYGIMLIFVLGGSCALSMAEIASVYPTAGGQYHWTSILAPESSSRLLSYWCGICNVFGWVSSAAGFIIPFPGMILTLASFWHPDYVPETWHVFLIYQALNFLFTGYNIFLVKKKGHSLLQDFGFFLSLISFFVITITCLSKSHPKQSSEFVWTTFSNSSGWSSNAIVFLTGLVNPNFIFSGLDGAIHLAEECTHAATAIPRALMSTVVIGFVTALAFAVAMTYSYSDFEAVSASPFPIFEIWYQATSSRGAASVFLIILALCSCFAITGALQTASRLTWCFARDEAVVGSKFLSRVHPRWGVPVWALLANSAVVFILGCIYLGSSSAFNALVSTGLILQQLSFAFPAALMLYLRLAGGAKFEDKLPSSRSFKLPFGIGPLANALTIILALLALIFYDFPVVLPVTASNMNYACAVIGAIWILSLGNWFLYAKGNYHGPRLM